MLTTPLKIGLAAVCLVVVAVLIAIDQSRLQQKEEPASVAPAAAALTQAALPQALPVLPAKPEDSLICPSAPPADTADKKTAEAPKTEPTVAPAPPKKILIETRPDGQRTYTVVQGDTLYGISVKVYNTPRHYERIYDANQERIVDPNTLQIGMKLLLPDAAAKAAEAKNPQ